jgi:hypothetical protein
MAEGLQSEITSPAQPEQESADTPIQAAAEDATPVVEHREAVTVTERSPERAISVPRSTLPQLPFAKDIDPELLRERVAVLTAHEDVPRARLEMASVLAELSLATPDEREARDVLIQAEELYDRTLAEARPGGGLAVRANRSKLFLPVVRMQREGADESEMADAAYDALTASLGNVMSEMEQYSSPYIARPELLGVFTEDTIAALVARDGHVPVIASDRERFGANQPGELKQTSDFHLVQQDGSKLLVRTKYNDGHSAKADYNVPMAVVKYIPDVCRPIVQGFTPPYIKYNKTHEQRLARDLSQRLADEGAGKQLKSIKTGGERVPADLLLGRAQRAVIHTIRDWGAEHPHRPS